MIIGLDSLPLELVTAVARFLSSPRDTISFWHTSKRNYVCAREALFRYPGAVDRAFNWAIKNGSVPLLREVLQHRSTYANKGTLRMACKHGHVAIFEELISRPDFRKVLEVFFDPSSFTKTHILCIAAHHRQLDMVKRIAALPELDVSAFHAQGQVTPLAAALREFSTTHMLTALLDAGADPKKRRPHGDQLIVLAAIQEHKAALNQLFDLGADQFMSTEDWESTMTHLGSRSKHVGMILLAQCRPDSMKSVGVVQTALWTSAIKVIQTLLDSGVDWTQPGFARIVPFALNISRNAGHWHAHIRQLWVTKMIVENGAIVVPDWEGVTPLSRAVRLQDVKTFPFFYEHAKASGGNADAHTLSEMLHYSRCSDITRVLVGDGGADVNFLNNYGLSPLLAVMQYSHYNDNEYNKWGSEGRVMRNLEVLIEYGADVNYIAQDGSTALQVAMRSGRSLDFIRMLVKNGARVPNPVPEHVRPKYPLLYIYMVDATERPAVARLLMQQAGGNPDELPLEPIVLENGTRSVTRDQFVVGQL